MGYAKRFLTKFEMDLGCLESFLFPLVVESAFIKAYQDTVGGGDFYMYDKAAEIVEDRIPNRENRRSLLDLLALIGKHGSVAKARMFSSDVKKFRKDLILLRSIGINGALIETDSVFDKIKNPIDEVYGMCKKYSL